MASEAASATVVYCRVLDSQYPRNKRIREAFSARGAHVVVRPRVRGPRMFRIIGDCVAAARPFRGADVFVMAEEGLTYAGFAWLAAKLSGATLVIDGFIGMYESRILDWKRHPERSLMAMVYRAIDGVALRVADFYLTDTKVRAEEVSRRCGKSVRVLSLPVGAPAWARVVNSPRHNKKLTLLYYGNYIPLHGVPFLLRAVARAASETDLALTMVGPRGPHVQHRKLAVELGIDSLIDWRGKVDQTELAGLIAEHDIVLGVFGESSKATSVIANKVWQGLACGATVVTQASPALAEVSELVGTQLVQTKPHDVEDLAAALTRLAGDATERPRNSCAASALEHYVQGETDVAMSAILESRRQVGCR